MDLDQATVALSALSLPNRLAVFRLLVQAGDGGMSAGDIARATGTLSNTLSANLNVLSAAGLVRSRRDGRSIIYTAAYDQMRDLLAYLMEDCCAGRADICAPLAEIANRASCCEPSEGVRS